jgi:DUF1707 SHOCT-like domain
MDDRMRVSDADRDRVAARLREHFAEGRLTSDEMDERISAALNAKTAGDLRHLTSDLPEPAVVPPQPPSARWQGAPPWIGRRRGPRILPLLLLVLLVSLLVPGGGWVLAGFFKVILVFWLVAVLAGLFLSARFYRRMGRGYPRRRGRPRW